MPVRKIFLLSPASLTGVRARQLTSPRARFEAARLYRSPEGVPIAAAFAFMSALYFRGKIAYALHFAESTDVHVIAPGFGLVPPGWPITEDRMKVMRRIPVDVTKRSYVEPLIRDAVALAGSLRAEAEVVLLGSVATGKYVDVLLPIFGERLRFPAIFAGLGDMSRGGLLLRAVRSNRELEYASLSSPRHKLSNDPVELAREWARNVSSSPMGPKKSSSGSGSARSG
ncbi:MAG TPA: hypothetical protein VNA04_08845 [Thermoanaerobaculia bacterium]|nr:hypothetical protein [Thermoanaerobaculia bacterium]